MGSDLKVLLINAVNPNVEVENRYPNLGLGYLVAMFRQNFPAAKVTFKITDRNIPQFIASFNPDLVGISAVSQNYTIALGYADWLAQKGIPYIMGGIHISALPETLPRTALLACVNESEETFPQVIQLALEGKLAPAHFNAIPGIAYWSDDTLAMTPPNRPIKELDQIPFPARDLMPIHSHTYMFTSRGCPFKCTFCASTRFWDQLRFFSADYVAAEIEMLYRDYDVSMISFFDDLFVASRKRLEQIIRRLEKKNLLGKISYTCSCRANVVDSDLAQMLNRLGVVSVGLGLESGDEKTLAYLKGKTVRVEDNYKAVATLKKYGIAANGSFVIGSPRETREQIMKTYQFIKKSNMDLFDIYLLTPYPGTPVWEYAKSRDLVSDHLQDWSVLDVNVYRNPSKCIILSELLSRQELLALYKKFRRLRLAHNIRKVIHHPMKKDLPRMAFNMLLETLNIKKP